MHTMAPNTTNSLANSLEICIAKSISYKKHPTACSKQSGCKQSPQKYFSTFHISDDLSCNLKCHGIIACLGQPKQAAKAILHQQAHLLARGMCKAMQTLKSQAKHRKKYKKDTKARKTTSFFFKLSLFSQLFASLLSSCFNYCCFLLIYYYCCTIYCF